MRDFRHLKIVIFLLVFFNLTFPGNAYAYIDPGIGSYIFQIIIAALLGAAYTIKLFWGNIKTFFENTFSKRK